MELLVLGVSSATAPAVFDATKGFFVPTKEFQAPSQQSLSRWRQGAGVLALLHAAVTLATCVAYTLHTDLSSKKHLKLGTMVLRCLMADGSAHLVALGGVFTQSGGTAVESKDQIMAALDQAEELITAARAHVVKHLPDFDVDQFIPTVQPGTLGRSQDAVVQSDHAFAAQATAKELQKALPNLLHLVQCADHVRTNMCDAATAATNDVLLNELGAADPDEFLPTGNVTSTFIRALYKEFQDTSYELGKAKKFRDWMTIKHAEQYLALHRVKGNRNDIYVENAGIVLVMLDFYTAYLEHLGTKLNKLERLLLKQCGSLAIRADLRARAILWFAFLQPYRVVANDTELQRNYLDMACSLKAMDTWLSKAAVEGLEGTADKDAPDIFEDPKLKKLTDVYRTHNARAYAAACTDDNELPELFSRKVQKAAAAAARSKMRDLAAVLLPGGKYAKPSDQQRNELSSTLPVNRPSESAFGVYDRLLHTVSNATHFTYSTLTAAKIQGTIAWLKDMPEDLCHALVLFGRERRQMMANADRKKLRHEMEMALVREEEQRKKRTVTARRGRVARAVATERMSERATTRKALTQGVKKRASKVAKRKYLKLQINLAKHLGVPPKKLPKASRVMNSKQHQIPLDELQSSVGDMVSSLAADEIQLSPPVPRKSFVSRLQYRTGELSETHKEISEKEMLAWEADEQGVQAEAKLIVLKLRKKAEEQKKKQDQEEKKGTRGMEEEGSETEDEEDDSEEQESEKESEDEEEAEEEENSKEEEKGEQRAEEPHEVIHLMYPSWAEALPRGGVILDKPPTLTRSYLLGKGILLRGKEGWFRGKIALTRRGGNVTVLCDDPDEPNEPIGVAQLLTFALYSTRLTEEGTWVLFG